jgi:iron-sulfur cluster assembly protein
MRPHHAAGMTLEEFTMSETTTQALPEGFVLNLTDEAVVEVKKFMSGDDIPKETAGLRISVLPGGCSGFKYSLNIEDKPADDDMTSEINGVRVFVDAFSAQYLSGVTINYVTAMQGSGFTFNNPNATGGCGCGTSFNA